MAKTVHIRILTDPQMRELVDTVTNKVQAKGELTGDLAGEHALRALRESLVGSLWTASGPKASPSMARPTFLADQIIDLCLALPGVNPEFIPRWVAGNLNCVAAKDLNPMYHVLEVRLNGSVLHVNPASAVVFWMNDWSLWSSFRDAGHLCEHVVGPNVHATEVRVVCRFIGPKEH